MRIVFVMLVMCMHYSVIQAQYSKAELNLSSQKQINDFGDEHFLCPSIEGDVMIGIPFGKTDITDLSPLKHLKHIGGYLNILNNSELKTLEGLDNLETIGSFLNIYNNDRLTNLNGLQNLTKTGGFLWVIKNEKISSITGLQNVKTINGSLDISDNPSLISLEGIQHIDPTSIKPTLDFQLINMSDIKFEIDHKIIADKWSKILYEPTSQNLVKRFHSLLPMSYAQRAIETAILYRKFESIQDAEHVQGILDQFAAIVRDSGNTDMRWEVELLKYYWQLMKGSAPLEQRIAQMQTLAKRAGQEGKLLIQARALKFISYKYLLKLREYDKIFNNYTVLEQVLDQLSPEEFPDMAQCYMLVGRAHYFFKDYKQAIRYFRRAAVLPKIPYNTTFIMHSLNNLGMCYRYLNHPDSSDFYFNQILRDTTSYPVGVWRGIASGNLGQNHYHRGAYDQAIPLLQRDIYNALAMDDAGLAAASLIPLADIRLIQNDTEEAKHLIDRARACIYKSWQKDRLKDLFPILTKWYAAMGQKDRVADYIDSTEQVMQGYNDKIHELKLLRIRQESSAKLHLNQMEQQRLKQQRNLIIVIIFLLFIVGSVLLWYRNKNIQRKQQLHDLKLQNARDSLDNARARLGDQAKKISENDKVIHQFKQEFKGHIDPPALQELKSTTILTHEDWVLFKKNFQKAYPGVLNKLKTSYPDLTPAELRLLCLLKLGLTNREMATAQGVSPQSIYVTNHRIRKKLQLDSQSRLEELVRGMS